MQLVCKYFLDVQDGEYTINVKIPLLTTHWELYSTGMLQAPAILNKAKV